jgi:DNA ligase (NAD+)
MTNFCVALGMKGINESIISTLIDNKIISNEIDIMNISQRVTDIISIDGFSSKNVKNLISVVEDSKTTTLGKFIQALSIEGIGKEKSEVIASHCSTGYKTKEEILNYLESGMIERISEGGIGKTIKENFKKYFNENIASIRELISYFSFEVKKSSTDLLGGKSFCVTGTLSMKRDEILKLVTLNGGVVKSGVTKDLDFLIVGQDSGSKKTKAESVGVVCIDEQSFFKMINYDNKTEKEDSESESEYENDDLF